MAENINLNININGQKDVDKTTSSIEKMGKQTNKTVSYMAQMRKELKDAKSALLQAEEGSQAYNNALAKVADISFKLKDSQEKARLAVMDIGQVSQNVGRAISGLAGGFSTAAGALALFGGESETSLKVIQKLTAAIAVVQGLTAFADTIDSIRDLMVGLSASSAAANGNIDNLNETVSQTVQTTANATTNLVGMNQASNAIANSTDEFTKRQEELLERLDNLKKAKEEGLNVSAKEEEKLGIQIGLLAKKKKVMTEGTQEYKANAEAVGNLNNNLDQTVEATKKVSTGMGSMAKNILKSFGWTALISLAITGIIAAVSFLIDKLNEIPRDLEIKLGFEEEVSKKMVDELTTITKFVNDYRVAYREGDKERIKKLEEIGKKEYNLTKDRLNWILDTTKNWRKAFDEYLLKAKDTYLAELRIRAGAEAEFNAKKAAARAQLIKDEIKSTMREAGFTEEKINETIKKITSGQRVTIGFSVDKLIRSWRDANDEVIKYNEELNTLSKIKIKPTVDFKTGVETTPTKTTTEVKIDKVVISPETLAAMKEQLNREITNQMNKSAASFAPKVKLPGFNLPTNEIKGTTPEYYQKQLDDLQRMYDMGLKDYDSYLIIKSRILENAESADIKISETSFQTRQEIMSRERESFEKRIDMYTQWADSLSTITDAISSIYDARLTALDNFYNAERALVEQSTLSEEEKNKKLNKLDQERYVKQKELFEQQKKWQIANIMINLAAGIMGVYTRATSPLAPPSPFNFITAGLEAAALIATSVAQIANINSTQLEAPNTGSATGGGNVASVANAVSPARTTTTSSAETLNKINFNARNGEKQNVVKVSDINKVQSNTTTREVNQNY